MLTSSEAGVETCTLPPNCASIGYPQAGQRARVVQNRVRRDRGADLGRRERLVEADRDIDRRPGIGDEATRQRERVAGAAREVPLRVLGPRILERRRCGERGGRAVIRQVRGKPVLMASPHAVTAS